MLKLRSNVREVIDRTKHFYEQANSKGALIQVRGIQSIGGTQPPNLKQYDLPNRLYDYLDDQIKMTIAHWSQRKNVDDDMVPSVGPWFGIAEHSSFIGGDVDFSDITSWHHPIIHTWEDMRKLSLEEDNKWFRMVMDSINYFRDKMDGQAAVRLRGANSPMDIANAIRGNNIFMDFYDEPEKCQELIEFCRTAGEWTLSHQLKRVGDCYGGVVTGFDVWLPGSSIGHLAEDTSTMCSEEIYTMFGKPYTEKLVEPYDHAFMHTHALGKHNLLHIADIDKIDFIEISSDPNTERAIEVYKEYESILKNKITVMQLTLDEIKENLEFLKNNRTIIWYTAKDVEDAENAVKFVRKELAF